MGKHRKQEDYNQKPFDKNASPSRKAKEFDEQYGQNRKYTDTPATDAKKKK